MSSCENDTKIGQQNDQNKCWFGLVGPPKRPPSSNRWVPTNPLQLLRAKHHILILWAVKLVHDVQRDVRYGQVFIWSDPLPDIIHTSQGVRRASLRCSRNFAATWVLEKVSSNSEGTFPILSRDLFFVENLGKRLVVGKNDG